MYALCHTTLNIDREQFKQNERKFIIIGSDLFSGIKKKKKSNIFNFIFANIAQQR